jgi:hypothetical protein
MCRTAFFGLCLIPTAIVLAIGVSRHLPGRIRAEESRLSGQLGQMVSIEQIRHPRPGVVVYEGLELADPETSAPILRCRAVEARWTTSSAEAGENHPVCVLAVSGPDVAAARGNQLWRLIERVLTRRVGVRPEHVRLLADEATLQLPSGSQLLTDVRCDVRMLDAGSQIDVSFQLAGTEASQPVRIRVGRDQQLDPPATGWGVHTGGTSLPCALLAKSLPALDALGPQCRFNGYFWANETRSGWSGELVGQFDDVELNRLIEGRCPHTLRGAAQVTIQEAHFRDSRLEIATGWLVAGPGEISRSLLRAAVERMGMIGGMEPSVTGALASYDRLALSFRLDSQGMQLRGGCAPSGSGVVLSGSRGPLLAEPTRQPVPIVALLEALAPDSNLRAPATPLTSALMRRLPLP